MASDPFFVAGSAQSRGLCRMVRRWADETPLAIAIVASGRAPLTYAGLFAQVEAASEKLRGFGLERNDCVAVALSNGPEMAVAFLAIAARNACAPLNPAYRANELAACLESLQPRALMVEAGVDSPARSAAESLGLPVIQLTPCLQREAGVFALSSTIAPRAGRNAPNDFDDVALVLQTSGTTSRPKIVPLTHANLCASAGNVRDALGLTASDRCLNVMPLFHIHGLVGAFLASLSAGASVACTPGYDATQFFEWIDEFRPTWYTAVPTMHQGVLARAPRHRETIARTKLRLVRSCSAMLPAQAAMELERVFSAPVVDSYGMTEASHQIASTPLGRRKSGSVGVAAGTEIAIWGNEGHRLAAGEEGEIVIRGAGVISGYHAAPEITREAFTGPWFKTGDLGRLDADGYLYITGRLKEIINRAGTKISPFEIEEALLAHPAVREAVAFGMTHDYLGQEPAAAVVLNAGTAATESELRDFAAQRLADFKVPRRLAIVDEVPRTATGKPRRIELAETLAGLERAEPALSNDGASSTSMEALVADIWREVLRVESIGIHDDFFDLGGDSILAARIISRVRHSVGADITFLAFFDAPTVAGIAKLLCRTLAGSQRR